MYLGGSNALVPPPAPKAKDIIGKRYALLFGGDWSVGQVVGHLARLVRESARHSIVLDVVRDATGTATGSRPDEYIRAISGWLPGRYRFIPDTRNVETIVAPWLHCNRLKSSGETFGDCDDYAGLVSALLRGCGVRCRFVTVASGKFGKRFDHIRAEAHDGKKWISMDPFPIRNITPIRQGAWEI